MQPPLPHHTAGLCSPSMTLCPPLLSAGPALALAPASEVLTSRGREACMRPHRSMPRLAFFPGVDLSLCAQASFWFYHG